MCPPVADASTVPVRTGAPGPSDPSVLAARIRGLVREAGVQRCGITGIELGADEGHLRDWLARGVHRSVDWMARHGGKRSRPQGLVPGTISVI